MGRRLVMAGGHEDVGDILTKFWPMITGAAIAVWAVVRSWFARRELTERTRGELITIAQNAAKDAIVILTAENARLSHRVDELESDFAKLQNDTASSLRSKDAEITLLRGNLGQALALVGSYERLLTENKIPHEQPMKPFWELANREATPVGVGS